MTYKTINLKQGSSEWLEYRRSRIGASDAAAILGESPYNSPYTLWAEKILDVKKTVTSSMRYGHEQEEPARQIFEQRLGCIFFPKVCESEERPWQIASLDGLTIDGDVALEIKLANGDDHEIAKQGRVPAKYVPQLQHQMSVIGLDKIFYGSRNYQGDTAIVEFKRNDSYINLILEAEEKFYYENMLNKTPPAYIDFDEQRLFEGSWQDVSVYYMMANEVEKRAKKDKDRAMERIHQLAKGKEHSEAGYRLKRSIVKGSVDYEALLKENAIDAERYRKESTERWNLCKG
jgi:putative phage-type endonuclease